MYNTKFSLKTIIYHWGEDVIKGLERYILKYKTKCDQIYLTFWTLKTEDFMFLNFFISDWWEGEAGVTKFVQNTENKQKNCQLFIEKYIKLFNSHNKSQ